MLKPCLNTRSLILDRKPASDGKIAGGDAVKAATFPKRATKFVMGGSHIGTGGDRYLLANRPSEGSRATRRALDDPSRETIAHYLRVHIDDESLVTDELVDYVHRAHTWSPEFIEANHIADSRLVLFNNCGHWPPSEKRAEWAAQVLAFLQGYWERRQLRARRARLSPRGRGVGHAGGYAAVSRATR